MKYLACFIVAMSSLFLLLSCTRTIYVPVQTQRSEDVILHDTIVEVVTMGEKYENKTTDTTSVLRSDRAYSVATVMQGTLSHTLEVLPRRDSIVLQWREIHTIDSVAYPVSMPGERIEVVPLWMWWIVVGLTLGVLFLTWLLRRRV